MNVTTITGRRRAATPGIAAASGTLDALPLAPRLATAVGPGF